MIGCQYLRQVYLNNNKQDQDNTSCIIFQGARDVLQEKLRLLLQDFSFSASPHLAPGQLVPFENIALHAPRQWVHRALRLGHREHSSKSHG